jgi:hypothetical protein
MIFGNFGMLEQERKNNKWKEIVGLARKENMIGKSLLLYCQNHPTDKGITATTANDFKKAPEGGCMNRNFTFTAFLAADTCTFVTKIAYCLLTWFHTNEFLVFPVIDMTSSRTDVTTPQFEFTGFHTTSFRGFFNRPMQSNIRMRA